MAKLTNFRVNSKAINAGEWISPGEEYDDLEILTRGFTDTYTDVRAAKLRKASMRYGLDERKIPFAESRGIIVEVMIEHVLLDVRGLVDDSGAKVDFTGFCDMLRDPDYAPLFAACVAAAAKVGIVKADAKAEALGN